MNERTFLKQFAESVDRDRLVDVVYDEMAGYCRENGITEDELSTPQLEQLAEGVVTRGLSFEREGDEWTEMLGTATDGRELD